MQSPFSSSRPTATPVHTDAPDVAASGLLSTEPLPELFRLLGARVQAQEASHLEHVFGSQEWESEPLRIGSQVAMIDQGTLKFSSPLTERPNNLESVNMETPKKRQGCWSQFLPATQADLQNLQDKIMAAFTDLTTALATLGVKVDQLVSKNNAVIQALTDLRNVVTSGGTTAQILDALNTVQSIAQKVDTISSADDAAITPVTPPTP